MHKRFLKHYLIQMKLPKTGNSSQLNAFQKGYRLALEDKPLSMVPATIKEHHDLLAFFEDGWQQARTDENLSSNESINTLWKKRFTWLTIMILGGLATAVSIINKYESSQPKQQSIEEKDTPKLNEIALLTEAERSDLALSKQELKPRQKFNIYSKLEPSKQTVLDPTLSDGDKQIFQQQRVVPKNIKQLQFSATLSSNNKGIKIQWIYLDQLIKEEIILKDSIKSKIKLASNWSGKWTIQIVKNNNTIVYRQPFNYIK